MGLYSRLVLPHLVHYACSGEQTERQRAKVVPKARGRVLEVGIGSGLNLPFYDPGRVTEVLGLEASAEMVALAEQAAYEAPFDVEFLLAGSEEIPLPSASCDTVVVTYALCTIPDVVPALKEMGRVLKAGGTLLFCEHGLAPDADVRKWQDRLDPVWRRLAGGCHLNRDIPALLHGGGFQTRSLDTMYVPGWRPACFEYWGSAVSQR